MRDPARPHPVAATSAPRAPAAPPIVRPEYNSACSRSPNAPSTVGATSAGSVTGANSATHTPPASAPPPGRPATGRPIGHRPEQGARRLHRQPRLARPARPGQRDQPVLAQQRPDPLQIRLPAHKASQLRPQIRPPLAPRGPVKADAPHPVGAAGLAVGAAFRGRRAQDLTAPQDLQVQRRQLSRRIRPELIRQPLAHPPVHLERRAAPARGGQRAHQQPGKRLAHRIRRQQPLKLGDQPRRAPRRPQPKVRVDPTPR